MSTVRISKLLSTDIRSRANANIIRSLVDGVKGSVILDFTGVTFISRSFADELYNVIEEHKNIVMKNETNFVKSMMLVIIQSRKSKKRFYRAESEIKEFEDMKSLESFLATIG